METPAPQNLSIPHFLLQSLISSSTKVQAGNLDQLAYHGLIKILIEEALHTLTLPIAWEVFWNMTTEDDIKALTYDVRPTGSEDEEQQGAEGGASGGIVEQERNKEGTEIEEEIAEETEQEETKKEKRKEAEKEEQGEETPETLEREGETTLTTLNTPIKPKQKRKTRKL